MIKSPEALCEKIGFQFDDVELLRCALTHRSAGSNNNERLEFLGDSILGFVIADNLFERFPEEKEGILSRFRANLVNQESLASIARSFELGDYLILGVGELKSGGFRRDSILSDALEGIIGALAKDRGIDVCRKWVLEIFTDHLDGLSVDSRIKDPKTQLQEIMQARGLELPAYKLISQTGLPHDQIFKIECWVSLLSEVMVGEGPSRKKAEQHAAEQVLNLVDSNQ